MFMLLARMARTMLPPFDEAGPAGQLDQTLGQIVGPMVLGNLERMQGGDQGIVRTVGKVANRGAPAAHTGQGKAPIMLGERLPCVIKAEFPSRHGTCGKAFVE